MHTLTFSPLLDVQSYMPNVESAGFPGAVEAEPQESLGVSITIQQYSP